MKDLEKLFFSELSDIYDAEHQLTKALTKMAKLAKTDELRQAFESHLSETKGHAQRLEQVFRTIGESPKRKTCKGIEGIIDEGELLGTEFENNTALDAALICAAQKTEHYEITSYGALCTWAKELDNHEALMLLKENLSEEKKTDERLTQLAMSGANAHATRHDTEKRGEMSSKLAHMVS